MEHSRWLRSLCSPVSLTRASGRSRKRSAALRNSRRWLRKAVSPSRTFTGRLAAVTSLLSARRRRERDGAFFERLLAWQCPIRNFASVLVRRDEENNRQDGLIFG